MGAQESLAAVRVAVARLDESAVEPRQPYDASLGMRRITSDVRRLADDLAEIGELSPSRPEWTPMQPIPDTPYDRSRWDDAEDEGPGAPNRLAP